MSAFGAILKVEYLSARNLAQARGGHSLFVWGLGYLWSALVAVLVFLFVSWSLFLAGQIGGELVALSNTLLPSSYLLFSLLAFNLGLGVGLGVREVGNHKLLFCAPIGTITHYSIWVTRAVRIVGWWWFSFFAPTMIAYSWWKGISILSLSSLILAGTSLAVTSSVAGLLFAFALQQQIAKLCSSRQLILALGVVLVVVLSSSLLFSDTSELGALLEPQVLVRSIYDGHLSFLPPVFVGVHMQESLLDNQEIIWQALAVLLSAMVLLVCGSWAFHGTYYSLVELLQCGAAKRPNAGAGIIHSLPFVSSGAIARHLERSASYRVFRGLFFQHWVALVRDRQNLGQILSFLVFFFVATVCAGKISLVDELLLARFMSLDFLIVGLGVAGLASCLGMKLALILGAQGDRSFHLVHLSDNAISLYLLSRCSACLFVIVPACTVFYLVSGGHFGGEQGVLIFFLLVVFAFCSSLLAASASMKGLRKASSLKEGERSMSYSVAVCVFNLALLLAYMPLLVLAWFALESSGGTKIVATTAVLVVAATMSYVIWRQALSYASTVTLRIANGRVP